MNLVVNSPLWLTIPLVLLVFAAAVEDAVRLRISNVTCGLVLLGAIIAMAVHGFSIDLWQNAVICLAILAIGTPAFAAGWLGGGDIKLLAALGLWVDFQAALGLLAAVFVAGGILAIVSITVRRLWLGRSPLNPRDSRMPFGVAIAAGAFFVFGIQLSERPTNPIIAQLRSLNPHGR